MSELPASSPRHLIHGAAGAFTVASGAPTDFKFTYGTWSCPDVGNVAAFGVITDYSVAPVGDAENLKDGGGSTMAHVIKDPGWEITASVMVAKTSSPNPTPMGPRRMAIITFIEKIEVPGTPENWSELKAVVLSSTVKWSREGWTMLEIKAESRDSMNLGITYGTRINELSDVTAVIHTEE